MYFTFSIHRLAENGLLYRTLRFWNYPRPECLDSSDSASFHVGLQELYPALIILACGMMTSVGILIMEIIQKKVHKMHLKQAMKKRKILVVHNTKVTPIMQQIV